MTGFSKFFGATILSVISISSTAVASLEANTFEMETKRFETVRARAEQKIKPCEKIDLAQELEYRDCLAEAAVYALSYRDKNDSVNSVFDFVFNKIDDAFRPGAAMKIATEAVEGFKDSKNDVKDRATYYEILKNLMSQLNGADFKPIFQYIKDAKLEIPDDVAKERLTRIGLKTPDLTPQADIKLSRKYTVNTVEVSD